MDGGTWRATVPGVAKSWTQLRTHAHSTGQCKYINQKPEITTLIGNKVGFRFKKEDRWRNQDGGGVGWGDHFLFYKFIERTTER